MTSDNDVYVDRHFVSLDDVAAAQGQSANHLRALMLDRKLPLRSYLRSDGTEMVPRDFCDLASEAGGVDALPDWFKAHWTDRATAEEEWDAYLSGQYVCLRSVRPESIQRKADLTASISDMHATASHEREWLARLHELVDELDALELPFTSYDRLRFGGPTARETMIDRVREQFPRPSPD